MTYTKKQIITVATKVHNNKNLTPEEITQLLNFEKPAQNNTFLSILKRLAIPLSLIAGLLLASFADFFAKFTATLPAWTNLSPPLLAGVDYLWNFFGEPIKKSNIIYHIPNIALYTFGIAEIKTLIDSIEHRSWLKKVLDARAIVQENIEKGHINLKMKEGHSLLFVGDGDFIGTQFAHNHEPDETVTIATKKPDYTNIWNCYDVSTLYEDLKAVIQRSSGKTAGEYVFFPVKDDQIFLPSAHAYDLSPHKLDIICQNIRMIEKETHIEANRIIIIGDTFHRSLVQSEDQKQVIANTEDVVSLKTISEKYTLVTLLDPTEIVIKKILSVANGRTIVFRATKEGIAEYKQRFYERLEHLGYNGGNTEEGILTIGYDIYEDQTEQQTLAHAVDDYMPVVLSHNVRDALLRNGYKKNKFIYVPDLVLEELAKIAKEQ